MSVQATLTGGETDSEREKPSTFLWCEETNQHVLRSKRYEWPHELVELDELEDEDEDEEEESEPERVGSWYDVTISVSTDYRFRIPAWDEYTAKDLAKEWRFDASPADSFVIHTDMREIKEITTEEVPDDYDPYGDTRLWEVFEDG